MTSEINFDEEEPTGEPTGRSDQNRRFILIGLLTLALVGLVAVLIYRIMSGGVVELAGGTPSPTPEPTEEPSVIATVEAEEPTVTPTRVILEESTEEPTQEPSETPTSEPTVIATSTPAPPTPLPSPTGKADEEVSFTTPVRIKNVLQNGDFEEGVDEQGVGLNWQSLSNGSAIVSFSSETTDPLVKSGSSAQRISIAEATRPDRYGGIYQQVEVVPNQPYTLELHGQIRTGLGDIQASAYGYRMQYAVNYRGGVNWERLPEEAWVELPWDEQRLDAADPEFLSYTSTITPPGYTLTLFIRAWNKWPDSGLAEYTLDDLSLVGQVSAPEEKVVVDSGEALIPVTGIGDPASLLGDGRFWGALVILLLLGSGAIKRGRWGH